MTRAWRVFGIGLVLLGAAVLGAYVHERYREASPAVPDTNSAAVAPTVPEVRPQFSLTDSQGRRRSISEWDGRPLLVNFWATWCEPCQREIPLLTQLQDQGHPPGLEVVGIAVDRPEAVATYLAKHPVQYPILIGEQEGLDVASAFGIQVIGFPITVFIDRRGEVLAVHSGELKAAEAARVLAVLTQVDAGAVTVAGGRDLLRKSDPNPSQSRSRELSELPAVRR
jgi:thiol-disulfide isomerase/thioredoxin